MKQQLSNKRLLELISAVRADKEENFEQLYAELLPLVYYRALVLLNDRDEAQKVTQACFVHIYKHIDELKKPEYFQAWLNAIVTSACRGMLQAREHAHDISNELGRDILADLLGGSESYAPTEALEAHEADEQIWASIQALSQKQKEVILLYYIEGLSVDDIAGVLGISYTAARSRLFKARRHLLNLLETGKEAPAASLSGTKLDAALEHMDAMVVLPFLARQLANFESSPRFGELAASIAHLVPEHHSLMAVAPSIWTGIVHELGLPALATAAAPVIAGTTISASQVTATAARAHALPKATGKLLPRIISRFTTNPAQAVVVSVASVAVVSAAVVGGIALAHHATPPAPPARTAAQSSKSARSGSSASSQPADTAKQNPSAATQTTGTTPRKPTVNTVPPLRKVPTVIPAATPPAAPAPPATPPAPPATNPASPPSQPATSTPGMPSWPTTDTPSWPTTDTPSWPTTDTPSWPTTNTPQPPSWPTTNTPQPPSLPATGTPGMPYWPYSGPAQLPTQPVVSSAALDPVPATTPQETALATTEQPVSVPPSAPPTPPGVSDPGLLVSPQLL